MALAAIVWGNVETQTRVVMDKIKALLEEAGCSLADIVKTTVYLQDARDFVGFNGVYSSYFEPGRRPARTTAVAPLVLDIKVEIDAVAYRRSEARPPFPCAPLVYPEPMRLEIWLVYFAAAVGLSLTPGPNGLLALTPWRALWLPPEHRHHTRRRSGVLC